MTEPLRQATAGLPEDELEGSPRAAALRELFSLHHDFVWRSLRRLGVAWADVDDALQEVFLVAFLRISEYEDRGSIRAWLFTISRRVVSHYHRRNTRADDRHQGLIWEVSGTDLEELLARREAERIVRSFLERLNEPQRTVFYLADIEGMTAPEIAAALGTKLNTVYARLRLARRRFRRTLAKHSGRELR